jgi:hypothetical protein
MKNTNLSTLSRRVVVFDFVEKWLLALTTPWI